jgi:uncharacterized membrane protein
MSVHAATTINLPPGQVENLWRTVHQMPDYGGDADVSFKNAPGDRGTEVHVILDRDAPAGVVGQAVQKLLGTEPLAKLKDDLRRFKAVAETGEIPRSSGTPEGTSVERQMKQRPAQPLEEVGTR